jgi:hypothetical protein
MNNDITPKPGNLNPRKVFCGLIPGLLLLAAGTPSSRAGGILTAVESGGDVVMTGSGMLNLTAWSWGGGSTSSGAGVLANSTIAVGPTSPIDFYRNPTNFIGPLSIGPGTGNFNFATSGTGNHFGLEFAGGGQSPRIVVQTGYISGNPLSASATLTGKTLASLGMTPGSYTWSWGSGGNADSLKLNVGSTPTRPTLTLSKAGGTVTVAWAPIAGTLQSAPAIIGPWSPLTTNSPYATPSTNGAEYYRVQTP